MTPLTTTLLLLAAAGGLLIAIALWKALRQVTRTAAETEILARKLNQELVPRMERVLEEAEETLAEARSGLAEVRALAGRAERVVSHFDQQALASLLPSVARPLASVGNAVSAFRQAKALALAVVAGVHAWRDRLNAGNGHEDGSPVPNPQTEEIES